MKMPCRPLGAWSIVFVALLGLAVAGCGGGASLPTVPAKGKATMDGQPLVGATLVFQPMEMSEGQTPGAPTTPPMHASGSTDANGEFTMSTLLPPREIIEGAIPGSYRVRFIKRAMKDGSPIPDFMAPTVDEDLEETLIAEGKLIDLIPPKYGIQSTLTMQIPPEGKTDCLFELQSK